MMNEPPEWVVRRAELTAQKARCAKSRRGVVLFDRSLEERRIASNIPIGDDIYNGVATLICVAEGHNRPPGNETCDGSEKCRESCSKRCIHAEMMAILEAGGRAQGCDLVHVKLAVNSLVAGGGPSCWQCSKLVLEVGIAGVWLYEEVGALAMGGGGVQSQSVAIGKWRFYTANEFHRATMSVCGIHRAVFHG